MQDSMLVVENLSVRYGDFQALWDVSIRVEKGEIVSIIGANGSGKTTLMKAICGILRPSQGIVRFCGEVITSLPAHRVVSLGITMVPEGRRIFPRLTVLENLLIGAYLPEVRKDREKTFEGIYELFPVLAERKDQIASTLSGGEQQMLAIARALMSRPKLLLLDEVSLGLAPIVIKEVYKKIKEINKEGITILLVEQNVKKSLEVSNRTYVLSQGKVRLEGKTGEITEEEVKKAYFGLL